MKNSNGIVILSRRGIRRRQYGGALLRMTEFFVGWYSASLTRLKAGGAKAGQTGFDWIRKVSREGAKIAKKGRGAEVSLVWSCVGLFLSLALKERRYISLGQFERQRAAPGKRGGNEQAVGLRYNGIRARCAGFRVRSFWVGRWMFWQRLSYQAKGQRLATFNLILIDQTTQP